MIFCNKNIVIYFFPLGLNNWFLPEQSIGMIIKPPPHIFSSFRPLSSSICFSFLRLLTFRGFPPPIHPFFFTLLSFPKSLLCKFRFFSSQFFTFHSHILHCPSFFLPRLILLSYNPSFYLFFFLPLLLLSFYPYLITIIIFLLHSFLPSFHLSFLPF